MAYPKVQGSIILKILVVVSALALAFSIYVPNTLWEVEVAEETECHSRLTRLADVQTLYAKRHDLHYAPSLDSLKTFIMENPDFRVECDSMIQEEHDIEIEEREKNGQPFRLFWEVPITVDSLFTCPSSGLPYIYQFTQEEEEEKYKILCPTTESTEKVYSFFEKKYYNHGEINQNKEKSW